MDEREFHQQQINKILNKRTKEARRHIRAFFADLCEIDWIDHDFLAPSIFVVNIVLLERKREGKE